MTSRTHLTNLPLKVDAFLQDTLIGFSTVYKTPPQLFSTSCIVVQIIVLIDIKSSYSLLALFKSGVSIP
jgi:hypothetical protein